MILWTMQPLQILNMIQETGVYRCDQAKSSMPELEFTSKYHWLIHQMEKRIGPPPDGVEYPVWAWHTQNWKHKKPDLRSERWGYGPGNEKYTCIEFEIPDYQVLLSDFDAWSIILNDGLLNETEAESDQMDVYYDSLSEEEQEAFKNENWQGVFDITPLDNDWMTRGRWIQATVWELRNEMIRDVRFFVTGKYKRR